MKDLNICSIGFRDGIKLLICRHDAHYTITGRDQRIEYMMVCSGCPMGRHNIFNVQRFIKAADTFTEFWQTLNIAIAQTACAQTIQKFRLIFPCQLE